MEACEMGVESHCFPYDCDAALQQADSRKSGDLFKALDAKYSVPLLHEELHQLKSRKHNGKASYSCDQQMEEEEELMESLLTIQSHLKDKRRANSMEDFAVNTFTECVRYTPPSRGDWIAMSVNSGKRVYLTVKKDEDVQAEAMARSYETNRQLLPVPFQDVKAEATSLLDRSAEIQMADNYSNNLERNTVVQPPKSNQLLWSEKYRPKQYVDLISNAGINRTFLTWLKAWDEHVFGIVKRKKVTNIIPSPSEDKDKKDKSDSDAKKGKFLSWKERVAAETEQLVALDGQKRPLYKVALLCGPPGLGKTTLAHVVAKHAGYNVVEANASDDRTVAKFRQILECATDVHSSVLFGDDRPNCVILDEIDGAPTDSINYLLSCINAVPPTPAQKKAGKRGKKQALRRPVIGICNDLYSPSLRELRKIALILTIPETDPIQLCERLFEICRIEKVDLEPNLVHALSNEADADIRSCINTIQMLRTDDGAAIMEQPELIIKSAQKDVQKSLFDNLRQIFDRRTTAFVSFTDMLNLANSSDDLGRLIAGLFENFLDFARGNEIGSVAYAEEWLLFDDVINQYLFAQQAFELYPYLAYTPLVFHLLFSSAAYKRYQYPKSLMELRAKTEKTLKILESLVSDVSPDVKSYNAATLYKDVLPYLLEIIRATCSKSNNRTYTGRHRDDYKALIDIMVSYNLTFRQKRNFDGTISMLFEPPVGEIVEFEQGAKKRPLNHAIAEVLTREIAHERLRKGAACRENEDESKSKQAPPKAPRKPGIITHSRTTDDAEKEARIEERATRQSMNHYTTRKDGHVGVSKTDHKDLSQTCLPADIWFKYNDGHNLSNFLRNRSETTDMAKPDPNIFYSEKYTDDDHEYRHVHLPKHLSQKVPKDRLMTEAEWRGLGITQSQGWQHYMIHGPERHIILFRRPRSDLPPGDSKTKPLTSSHRTGQPVN